MCKARVGIRERLRPVQAVFSRVDPHDCTGVRSVDFDAAPVGRWRMDGGARPPEELVFGREVKRRGAPRPPPRSFPLSASRTLRRASTPTVRRCVRRRSGTRPLRASTRGCLTHPGPTPRRTSCRRAAGRRTRGCLRTAYGDIPRSARRDPWPGPCHADTLVDQRAPDLLRRPVRELSLQRAGPDAGAVEGVRGPGDAEVEDAHDVRVVQLPSAWRSSRRWSGHCRDRPARPAGQESHAPLKGSR